MPLKKTPRGCCSTPSIQDYGNAPICQRRRRELPVSRWYRGPHTPTQAVSVALLTPPTRIGNHSDEELADIGLFCMRAHHVSSASVSFPSAVDTETTRADTCQMYLSWGFQTLSSRAALLVQHERFTLNASCTRMSRSLLGTAGRCTKIAAAPSTGHCYFVGSSSAGLAAPSTYPARSSPAILHARSKRPSVRATDAQWSE